MKKDFSELKDEDIKKVSGGTIGFHVFSDGKSGWVSSTTGDKKTYKTKREASQADILAGGSGYTAEDELNSLMGTGLF